MKHKPEIPTFVKFKRSIYDKRQSCYVNYDDCHNQLILSEGKFDIKGVSKVQFVKDILVHRETKYIVENGRLDFYLNILLNHGYVGLIHSLQNIIKEKHL